MCLFSPRAPLEGSRTCRRFGLLQAAARRGLVSTPGDQPTMMTVREVAGYLRMHEMTIYRMARHGEIPA
jgi:hypothetical protein